MRKFNADDPELFQAIEVTIDGKPYVVGKVSEDTLNALNEAGENDDHDTLSKQLGILLSVNPDTFRSTDLRKMAKVCEFIMSEFTGDIDRNPTGKDSED